MATNKLAGYSLVLASILLFVSGLPGMDGTHQGNILTVVGFTGIIFGAITLCDYLQKTGEGDNGWLKLIPVLAIVGWPATALSAGIDNFEEHANLESVNAVSMLSGSLFLSVGALGWLGNLGIQWILIKRTDFSKNMIYRGLTLLGALSSIGFIIATQSTLFLMEGFDRATAAGGAGSGNMSAGWVWMKFLPGLVITTLWSLATGIILSKKS